MSSQLARKAIESLFVEEDKPVELSPSQLKRIERKRINTLRKATKSPGTLKPKKKRENKSLQNSISRIIGASKQTELEKKAWKKIGIIEESQKNGKIAKARHLEKRKPNFLDYSDSD
ncbi:hypothetical protein BB559_003500 [Furculomyces boomerangus]|uniref:Uncharacterized protein n=2 Tax=Harpellales TaxID=61421 RepID=A0A2T9Y9E3_9FUNG|nr:hypothetical protein BB559_005301 [Furculomyces boomerangus]PVU91105.1 hypothetical protein BB559_004304 [Furculomyces boomerangus]PVU93015.1 hypothetical protein BB559_003500 [Furculomyces boomerangus]PVZ98927.1 hypothetical protein BB558_005065 [Smittium angustum]PWA02108.1 hypothetical protein BB558_001769 [Smittium angustum]